MLAAAAAEVLETMFFTGVYGPAQAGAYPAEPYVSARVGFEGTPSGTLTLSVSETAAGTLAANFLAPEDDGPLPAAQLGGVVCELANMICGTLLSHVKAEEQFRLCSPELLLERAACAPPPNQSLSLGDGPEDGTIDFWLDLEHHAN